MATPITQLPNLGPASEASFARAGITTAEEIRALGAHEAYRQLVLNGTVPHFIGYYVLVMALQGRPWHDCKGDEKKALRVQFDALKAEVAGSGRAPNHALESALNMLGVVQKAAVRR